MFRTVHFQAKYIAQSLLWHAGGAKEEGTENQCTFEELNAATSRVSRRIRRLFIHYPTLRDMYDIVEYKQITHNGENSLCTSTPKAL